MEIWIVEDGGKKGPFETYLLRERIEGGELSGDELAWHKDQDGWVTVSYTHLTLPTSDLV